jgi:thioredoxin-related protein
VRNTASAYLGLIGLMAVVWAGCDSDSGTRESARPAAENHAKWNDHTQGLPFVFGYERGLGAARSQHKPAMMFVTTTWCGWCTRLAEENFNHPDVRPLLGNVVCVIVDGDTEKKAARKLGARGYPHIVFVSESGEPLAECSGYAPADRFRPIVEEALAKAGGK